MFSRFDNVPIFVSVLASDTACFFTWMAHATGGSCLMSATSDREITRCTINTLLAILGSEHDLSSVACLNYSDLKGADKVSTNELIEYALHLRSVVIVLREGD